MQVKIPSVGESVNSGIISIWHKKDGEAVQAGETLLTLDTDKVSTEIQADASGVLKILVPEGEEVEVGSVVAEIDAAGTPTAASDAGENEAENGAEAKSAAPDEDEVIETKKVDKTTTLSPAVKRIIEEEKLDPAAIPSSGKAGRLTKTDVLQYLEKGSKAPAPAPAAASSAPSPAPVAAPKAAAPVTTDRVTRKPMTPLRRKIAQTLVNAQHTAAMLTTFNEVDMTAIMELRKSMQDDFVARHGIKLGFMSFFVKAVVDALKAVPAMNASIDGEDLILNHFYDVGVAVGTDKGLMVPVLRDCDSKSFAGIEADIGEYAKKAREGKISLTDLQGGVFTISNGGIYGSLLSTPILNPPQSGILGMHSIQERPVARNGQVVIRPMMYLALSYDHRVVDGKEAVTFLVKVKQAIEDPRRLLLGI